jgi:ornithine cyclodeaminase
MTFLLLNEDELRQTINLSEAVSVIEDAFVALGQNRITIPGNFLMHLPRGRGEVAVKGAYLQDAPYYVIQVGSHFYKNLAQNLPPDSGLIVVFDADTGFPAALLIDNGYITHVRAGIAGALAAKYLANTPIHTVGVVGSGKQAFIQLKALLTVRTADLVVVWGRTPLEADAFARRIVEDHNVNIEIASTIAEVVRNADVLITATPSTEPIIRGEWLKPGVHITAVGSNSPTKQECHLDVLQRADVILVDNFEQCSTSGEIHHGLAAGIITRDSIQGNLSQLMLNSIPGRTEREQITLVDLTGLDWQDTVIATLALEKALFLGLGQRLQPGLEQRHLGHRTENLL